MTKQQRYASVLALLDEWLADESGYDDRVWPLIEQALRGETARDQALRIMRETDTRLDGERRAEYAHVMGDDIE